MARTDIIIVEGKAYTAGQIVDAIAAVAQIKSAVTPTMTSGGFVVQVAKIINAVDTAPVA